MATAAIDGFDSGSAIERYNRNGRAPSMDADSYNSFGICRKKDVKKKIEKEKAEYEKDRERVIERERVKEVMLNRPNLSDDQIHAMGLRTVPEIIEAMNKRNSNTNIELLDEKYRPIMQLDEKDKLREEELLRIMVSGTKLSMDEQLEFDILRRKKAVGIV